VRIHAVWLAATVELACVCRCSVQLTLGARLRLQRKPPLCNAAALSPYRRRLTRGVLVAVPLRLPTTLLCLSLAPPIPRADTGEPGEEVVTGRLEAKIHAIGLELARMSPNLKAGAQLEELEARLKAEKCVRAAVSCELRAAACGCSGLPAVRWSNVAGQCGSVPRCVPTFSAFGVGSAAQAGPVTSRRRLRAPLLASCVGQNPTLVELSPYSISPYSCLPPSLTLHSPLCLHLLQRRIRGRAQPQQ
jgi:hypothetical protein